MSKVTLRAILVGLLPPAWACLATFSHFQTGAVALICAGLILIKEQTNLSIVLGLVVGDIWGFLSMFIIQIFDQRFALVAQFLVLAIMGFAAVVLSSLLKKISLTGWLTGWAIAMQVPSLTPQSSWLILVLQIGISMVVGIYYIGVGIEWLISRVSSKKHSS